MEDDNVFTTELTEQLIEAVRDRPALYDILSPEYKNRNTKANAWDRISAKLEIDAKLCMKKWKTLRDQYTRQIRDNKGRSGDGAKRRKKFHFFDQLSFLNRFIKSRTTCGNNTQTRDDLEPEESLDHDGTDQDENDQDGNETQRLLHALADGGSTAITPGEGYGDISDDEDASQMMATNVPKPTGGIPNLRISRQTHSHRGSSNPRSSTSISSSRSESPASLLRFNLTQASSQRDADMLNRVDALSQTLLKKWTEKQENESSQAPKISPFFIYLDDNMKKLQPASRRDLEMQFLALLNEKLMSDGVN